MRLVEGGAERLPPAAVRGATVVPDRVLARLTDQAAREAVTRHEGAPPARAGLRPPQSSVSVRGGAACIAVSVDLTCPVDTAGVCAALAAAIAERVHDLTGLPVADTTVSVRRLVLKESLRQRRVR
ncbi:Asp23/Gls24 family envelope stress response protein [Streptomyces sp. PLK6-54]|uniref:Asp23/Gls24 family envelope stress response protein n=1 Tax=Actinacidiphila acidipaludis TaxID=2873382 RepID=A0ABS7Q274_9ACTN|nr:Asp23/Gls24 family envelope stress response protein [Streptomyces acidipaludis]